jgi:putative phosphoesterase
MKIGVISDIHGNYEALHDVLLEAKRQKVQHFFVLGDIVGYYYYPDKVLDLLSDWSYDLIKGNHEIILEKLLNDPKLSNEILGKYGSGHQHALMKLSNKQLHYLFDLPEKKSVQIDDKFFLLCHGSPWSIDSYIYPDSKKELIVKCDSKKHDFVLVGHSHYSFAFKNKHSVLLNPGSVGQSRQKGGKAYWSIIDTRNGAFQFFQTEYKTQNLLNEIKSTDSGIKYLSEIIKRN